MSRLSVRRRDARRSHTNHREHKLSNLACRIVALLCAASLVACTSMRVVVDRTSAPDATPVSIDRIVAPNDIVVVTATDGQQTTLRVTLASADAIEGVSAVGVARFERDRIARVERSQADAVRTGLVVLAVALGVYLLAMVIEAAGTAALASNL